MISTLYWKIKKALKYLPHSTLTLSRFFFFCIIIQTHSLSHFTPTPVKMFLHANHFGFSPSDLENLRDLP